MNRSLVWGRFGLVAQEAAFVEFGDEVREEIVELALGGDRCFVGHQPALRCGIGGAPPFIGHDHDGLGQVQRHEVRVEVVADQAVGAGDVIIIEPGAFRAE